MVGTFLHCVSRKEQPAEQSAAESGGAHMLSTVIKQQHEQRHLCRRKLMVVGRAVKVDSHLRNYISRVS